MRYESFRNSLGIVFCILLFDWLYSLAQKEQLVCVTWRTKHTGLKTTWGRVKDGRKSVVWPHYFMFFCCIRLSGDETVFTNCVCVKAYSVPSVCMYQSIISGDLPADVPVHHDLQCFENRSEDGIGNWHTHQIWSLFQCQSSQKGIACLFKGFWETAVMPPVAMTTEREGGGGGDDACFMIHREIYKERFR